MSNFNFYKKNTVLNNILKNYSVNFSNSSNLLEQYGSIDKELYSISNEFEQQYIDNIDIKNTEYNNKSLFEILTSNFNNYYTGNINNLSKSTIINNIKRYNNSNTYINNSKYLDSNSIILDYSNNSYHLYYNTNNISLLSYNILLKNGFNYDKENHIVYFNIDNEYIKNIHNILYYNYNKINNIDIKNYGIFKLNTSELNTDDKNNLILNSEFKFNIQSNLKKLKKLYDDENNIYQKLDFYYNNDNYQNKLNIINTNDTNICVIEKKEYNTPFTLYIHENNVKPIIVKNEFTHRNIIKYKTNFIKNVNNPTVNYINQYIINNGFYVEKTGINDKRYAYSFSIHEINNRITVNNITYISYEIAIKYVDSNLYYSDNNYQINNINIKNNNTIYTKNVNQTTFKILNNIENVNYNNINNFKNTSFIRHYNKNNIDLDIKYNNNVINHINESNNLLSYNICESSTYILNINTNIDNIMFYNSGITIEYKESPYLSNVNNNYEIIDYGEGDLKYNNTDKYILTKINYKKYYQVIYLPLPNYLNINYNNNNIYKTHSANKGIFNKNFYKLTSENNNKAFNNSYYILSSTNLFLNKPEYCEKIDNIESVNNLYNYESNNHYIKIPETISTYKFYLNNYIIEFLKSNNLLYSSYDLNYYTSYNYYSKKYDYYPILNNYPSKYINNKFFRIIKNLEFIDDNNTIYYNNDIPSKEVLQSCISNIRNLNSDILYLYEISLDSDLSDYTNNNINSNYRNLVSNSYIIFNTYTDNYNNDTDNIIRSLNNNNKVIFYNNLSSYIMSTYININSIDESNTGKNNLKKYITSYSNNFIKFI